MFETLLFHLHNKSDIIDNGCLPLVKTFILQFQDMRSPHTVPCVNSQYSEWQKEGFLAVVGHHTQVDPFQAFPHTVPLFRRR